jgi:hypothetical protein
MSELSSLIERIEAATGGDRELDVAVIMALYPEAGPYSPHCQGDEPIFWNAPYYKQECPHLTASLDDALTLLPEGYDWIIGNVNGMYGGTPYACAGSTEQHFAATPVLALLSAILKARQASNGDRHAGEKGE